MRKEIAHAALSFGANLGDPVAAFAFALKQLRISGVQLIARSSLYRTKPWGRQDQPEYLNMVALIETSLLPTELLRLCLTIESAYGRNREKEERWAPRTLDIDMIDFDGRAIDAPGLKLPHPRALERAFVLIPLAEIAPDYVLMGQNISQIASQYLDDSVVKDLAHTLKFDDLLRQSDLTRHKL